MKLLATILAFILAIVLIANVIVLVSAKRITKSPAHTVTKSQGSQSKSKATVKLQPPKNT